MESSEEGVERANIQSIEHLVELYTQVEFCELQYIVHIVAQTLNKTIWEFTDDTEIELFKEFVIKQLLLGELSLRLDRRPRLSDLETILRFFICWLRPSSSSSSRTSRYLIFNRFTSTRNNDKKFRRSPFKSVLTLNLCRRPQIIIGKDHKDRTRIIYLGLDSIEGGDTIKSITSHLVVFSEYIRPEEWQVATEAKLRELFVTLTTVLAIQDWEKTEDTDETIDPEPPISEIIAKYKAREDCNNLVALALNLTRDFDTIQRIIGLCSVPTTPSRVEFLDQDIWEVERHKIAEEKLRGLFPLETRLKKVYNQRQRYNFLCFDFTQHLELNLPLLWEPGNIDLSLFLDVIYKDIFFFNRHPELVESGPILEEIVNKDLLKYKTPLIKNFISNLKVADFFSAIRKETIECPNINALFPAAEYLADCIFKDGPDQVTIYKFISARHIHTLRLTVDDKAISRLIEDEHYRLTSSLIRRLLLGHLAILEQVHLKRCVSCRTWGVNRKRPTGALSIFCVGVSDIDLYPAVDLHFEANRDFLLIYNNNGVTEYFQDKIRLALLDKIKKGNNNTVQEIIPIQNEQQPESVTEPVSRAVENTTGDSADDGLRRSKRNKH